MAKKRKAAANKRASRRRPARRRASADQTVNTLVILVVIVIVLSLIPIAVAEACRNVASVGAVPIRATNCLNFGNPEKPEQAWELAEAIEGMAEACEALKLPIVSGNVSLYNETDGRAIPPTPVVGCVGLVHDVREVPRGWQPGDGVWLAEGDEIELSLPLADEAA